LIDVQNNKINNLNDEKNELEQIKVELNNLILLDRKKFNNNFDNLKYNNLVKISECESTIEKLTTNSVKLYKNIYDSNQEIRDVNGNIYNATKQFMINKSC